MGRRFHFGRDAGGRRWLATFAKLPEKAVSLGGEILARFGDAFQKFRIPDRQPLGVVE